MPRLTFRFWRSSLSSNHPERLPTLMPIVLAGVAGLMGLAAVVGETLLLVPLLGASFVLVLLLVPLSMPFAGALGALAGVLLLSDAPLRWVVGLILGVWLSPWLRQRLLRLEWRWAAQRVLAALLQNPAAESPEQAIAQALAMLKDLAGADGAIALRQLDGVTAEVLNRLPEGTFPNRLMTPALFAEAIAQNRCLYFLDYATAPNAAPVLLAQGVQAMAVIPLQQRHSEPLSLAPSLELRSQGGILLLWHRSVLPSVAMQECFESLREGLSNLLRFQDATLRLEKLQARLVAILETIPQGIVFVDESGEQGWLNRFAAEQLGLPQGATEPLAIAQAMARLRLRADNSEALAAEAAQLFAQAEIRGWQWRFSQMNKVLSVSSTSIHLRQVPGRLWVLDDITVAERREAERQRAEVALRNSQERLHLIAHTTNDAIWDWRIETQQVLWNDGIEMLFGYKAEEVGSDITWWYNHIHPEDCQRVITSIDAVIEQGQHFWSAEYRYQRANGDYVYVLNRGYVLHAPDGKPVQMLGGMTDISDRKQVQEELQRQTRKAQLFAEVALKIRQSLQIQDILQTAVTEVQKVLNADRVLIYRLWSNGTGSGVAEEMLPGLPTVLGYTFPEEVFPEEAQQLYAQGGIGIVEDVERDQIIAPCLVGFLQQFQVKSKLVVPVFAKSELWGLLIAHQCRAPRQWTAFEIELLQQLANQVGVAITQAQLLEQEVRQRQELSRSNVELQQFAYIASHDLQEPLRMVTSYLQLLERRYRGKLDANADEFIAFAVDGASRMKTLIDDLLSYSRVGTHGKAFELVLGQAVVERAIANLKIAIEESGAIVTLDPLPEVLGDPGQLVQLFQNLIGNAIKFRGEAPPIVHINVEPQAESWLFSVKDNGIGIESQYIERIFVIFQRLHSRGEYEGTGIGLAVCKKIVERHDGEIWLQSESGKGSIFYFTLPRSGETAS